MTLNPYDVLGLDRGANATSIKRAFRRRAKETHPDAGGDAKEFERVHTASLILLDPSRRKKYDETGKVDEVGADNAVAQAVDKIIGAIGLLVAQFVNGQGNDPAHSDLLQQVRAHFNHHMAQAEQEKRKGELAVRTYRKIREQMKPAKGTSTLLLLALDRRADEMAREADRIAGEIQRMRDCLTMLEAYAWTGPTGPMTAFGLGQPFAAQYNMYGRSA